MPSPRVLVVGIDAGDRDVVEALIADGALPTMASLFDEGCSADVVNPFGMFSGPVWPTIATGVPPDQHGGWTWRPLVPGTYRMEHRGSAGPVLRPTYWGALGAQGVRTITVDVPNVAVQPDVLGAQIVGWGQHDRRRGLSVTPASLAAELAVRHPIDALDHCDERGAARDPGELSVLAVELHDAIDRKAALVRWLLVHEPAEVVTVVFGEAHCAGHQFWHLRNPDHEHHDPALRQRLGDVVADTYTHLDRVIGELVDEVGAEHVVLVLSHGIADNVTMPHLLDPVLKRLDAGLGAPPAWVRAREFARRAPNRVARLALRAAGRDIEGLAHYVDGSRRFFPVPNFPAFGAVRLNLVGREPCGLVDPAEADEVLAFLERELLALRDVDSGRPMVLAVHRGADLYPDGAAIGMFDLLFEWDVSGQSAGVRSATVGEVRADRDEPREGGHRQDGRVVVAGPRAAPGRRGEVRAEDLAPTIADLVDRRLEGVAGTSFLGASVSGASFPGTSVSGASFPGEAGHPPAAWPDVASTAAR